MKTLLQELKSADAVLCQYGYVITSAALKKYLSVEEIEILLEKLTSRCEMKIGPARIGRSYKLEYVPNILTGRFKKIYTLPRAVAAKLVLAGALPQPKTLFTSGRPLELVTAAGFDLLDDQKNICKYIWENCLAEGQNPLKSSCILNFATGYGKTYIAAGLINLAAVMTVVILPNVGLVNQTLDVFSEIWPQANICKFNNGKYSVFSGATMKIGRGKKAEYKVVDIFVSTVDSWLLAAKTKKFREFDDVGLIIIDEIHTIGGINRMELLFNTHVPLMFGMSATTAERADEFDKLYIQHLGPLIRAESIPGFAYDSNLFFGKVFAVNYAGPDEYTAIIKNETTGMPSAGAMVKKLAEDPGRNKLIAKIVKDELSESGRFIYIFSESLEHLENIKKEIIAICDNELSILDEESINKIKKLTGGAKAKEINDVRESARVILTTYGYGGTGFSIGRMNTIIVASPRKRNFMQITGRIFRRGSDTSIERRIYDIIDTKSILRHQFKTRRLVYNSRGLKISFIK